MRAWILGAAALGWLCPILAQETPKGKAETKPAAKTPADEFKALVNEVQSAQQKIIAQYRAAKTQEERNKLIEEFRRNDQYAERFLGLANKAPKSETAFNALVWVVTNVQGQGQREGGIVDQAVADLIRDHIDNPKLGMVCQRLQYAQSKSAEHLLRTALAKSPNHEVQAYACAGLAGYLKNKAEESAGIAAAEQAKMLAEAEKLYAEVGEKYADVKDRRGSLAESAKGALFELRHLGIGKQAPEIAGDDIDGKPFKLSDYRGKVVVLDFWGNW